MAQGEDPAQAARRLEAALERIAFGAERLRRAAPAAAGEEGGRTVLAEVAERLDSLIAQLHHALAGAEKGPG